jgi:hypothetical protein
MKQVTGAAPKGEGAVMFFMGLPEGWSTIRSLYIAEHGQDAKTIDERTRFTRDYFNTRLSEAARADITSRYQLDHERRVTEHRELIEMSESGLVGLQMSPASRAQ